ncbi:PREDICTED: 1-aminocyclopropane-1-carboxylate oxidase-like [Fragaria vesca subsp. vesca]|uniref:1-aminocyclopropane-1-carboxylate oxidase-like n=1 Tax=Fragaria vesca subsp. vesca TaxID=101020 RepID=UPI0002C31DC7|nr:PREDICTED: 1-aminocyclopropane-1-carboxylate oxidase-like [Fragaria vesca subsp. vesca]
MAETMCPVLINHRPFEPSTTLNSSHHSSFMDQNPIVDTIVAVDDIEIPTVDFSVLLSDDLEKRSKAIENIGHVCEDFGFFYLVNHGVSDEVFESVFKGITDFFNPSEIEDRKQYEKKNPTDRIRWGLRSSLGENREYLKVIAHPEHHCPTKPAGFSEAMEEYFEKLRVIVNGLGKAVSKAMGFEECYIEKAFKLNSGFDMSAMNLYPPNFRSKGSIGVPNHTDPGFFVSLIQDVNSGLQILSHKGDWINVNMPRNAIFINLGDHLEILTNGKYKSHVHRVVVNNNKVKRISVATLHGPSLDSFVSPAPEFVDESHPPIYRGMTYKQSLEANGGDEIDVQSCLEQIRIE